MKKIISGSLLGILAIPGAVMAQELWITIGSDGYQTLKKNNALVAKQSLDARGERNGVTILKVDEANLSDISTIMHINHNRCGGFMVHDSLEEAQAAQISSLTTTVNTLVTYSVDNADVVNALQGQISESNIRSTIESLSNFTNRYYTTSTGVDGAEWIRDKWQALTSSRSDVSVQLYSHSWAQPSVILTIQGQTDPDEIVVLGAHLDSTVGFGTGEGTRAPGADDDASGIATLTDVINAIVATDYKPDKTLTFMGYAAEEVGLRGSDDIASDYKGQNKNVIGVLQLDMTNYYGSNSDIYIIGDYTNSAQNSFLEDLADTYLTDLTVATTYCGYACSDHASWYNQGYPASFPFEATFNGSNPYIHTVSDTLANSGGDASHAVKFGKLAAAYVAELAKGYVGDDPGPDPDPDPDPGEEQTETFSGNVGRSAEAHYGPFSVTPGTDFVADMTGTNDADLYVRFGAAPTWRYYDCRPYEGDTSENCSLTVPSDENEAYIMVRGYSRSGSDYELDVTYTPE
ncbi:M20/M25/M40 family metallo-hydrolase [Microbulbifer sp. OS29]|uniref:M20/M25/M40 family metallo-hydrolase n=1 Tax=Microbulbifer okhotskensis TaxID=2926617 RepID=A0A9X2EUE6_9GAMM|nr:M20/M25/M40 family metallo-hydrolase [Microbulbifer okhotskensis]MCO1336053.1 M20/M25/M40 family metallo-hydrolase [Microbulbifer okhotskensis]